jgi:5'-nucleotidase
MYTTYKGDVEAEMMNAIGFDAMAVGNHEFDDGPEQLAEFAGEVDVPLVSGNLDLSQSNVLGEEEISDYLILEVGGERIGIVSALATDTTETSSPGDAIIFQDEIEALQADVDALREDGVNKIIALNHVGLPMDRRIAEGVEGIDLIIGGHSHTLMSNTEEGTPSYPEMVNGTPIVQAYAYGKYVGDLTVVFDDAGEVTSVEGDTVLMDASVEPDAEIAARIAELAGPIEELKARVIGSTAAPIEGAREVCRAQECPMGSAIADAMLDRVEDQGIDVAIQNGGGIRASIDAGEITMGEVLTVLPFQNTLATFSATGQTIIDALENGVSEMADGAGRFPQVAGMSYTVDPSAEPGSRVSDVMVDGAPIDPEATYGVVTNNYVRTGGDGYAMFEDAADAYDFGPGLEVVFADWLAEQGPGFEPYTDGRITVTQ